MGHHLSTLKFYGISLIQEVVHTLPTNSKKVSENIRSHRRCSVKMTFLEISQDSQVFFCEFCEISKNTFFKEHLWTTASVNSCFSIIFSIFNKLKILWKDCLIDLSVSKNLSIQHAMYFYLKTEKHFSKHCLFISANHFSRSSF